MNRTETKTRKLPRFTALATAIAAVAMMIAPASGMAAAPVKFGAKLNPTVQPSNSLPGSALHRRPAAPLPLHDGAERSLRPARRRPDRAEDRHDQDDPADRRRPRHDSGSRPSRSNRTTLLTSKEGKLVHKGPKISYQGQTEANWESGSYRVESFDVNMRINRGEQLAIHSGDVAR